jgi:hypothetical protein
MTRSRYTHDLGTVLSEAGMSAVRAELERGAEILSRPTKATLENLCTPATAASLVCPIPL